MNPSSALVTGASGFVGRSVVRLLMQSGCAVTALGRSTSVLPEGVPCIRADHYDRAALRAALEGRTFDVLFHLAAHGVDPDQRNADAAAAVNIMATGALVDAAAVCGAAAVVYTGSCAEYDSGAHGIPIDEDHRLTRRGIYAASKVAGGFWGSAVAHERGINFCWLRLFGVYGPGERPHRLIPYLVERLRRDQIVDLTPGEQVRDLMFVDDMAAGIVVAGTIALDGQKGPFNLCTGHATTVRNLARVVADELGKPYDLLGFGRRPYRPDESLWIVGAPGRFRQASGFLPTVGLEAGIARTIHPH